MSASGLLQCTLVILREDFSVQSAYTAGEKVATEMKIPFQGTNFYTVPLGTLVKFYPTLAFQVDSGRIDELAQRVSTELKIAKSLLKVIALKPPQPVESGRPAPEGMIT